MKHSFFSQSTHFVRVPLSTIALFSRHISMMLSSGVSILEALEMISQTATGSWKRVLTSIIQAVDDGDSLAQALRAWPKVFPRVYVEMVAAGEASGTLAKNIAHVGAQLETSLQMRRKIFSALAYPSIIFFAAIVLALAMAYYVLPQMVPLFTGLRIELPVTTRIIISFSTFMRTSGHLLVIGIFLGVIVIAGLVQLPFTYPITHWLLLRLPLFGRIVRMHYVAQLSLSMGTMLQSGLPITDTLQISEHTVGNIYYKRVLRLAGQSVAQGESLSKAFEISATYLPVLLINMTHVGERSGNLDETLLFVANFYEEEINVLTKNATTILEPLVLFIVGAVVGFLALSIITPIYEITGNIQR